MEAGTKGSRPKARFPLVRVILHHERFDLHSTPVHRLGVLGIVKFLLDNVLSAAIAEALGLLRSLEFLERIGCSSKVSIESNSLQVIQCCNSKTEVYSPYAILVDCFVKESMTTDVSFHHCPRSANQVTHELVKFAYLYY
jgi:hypothetical protein